MALPYENATSGEKAAQELQKILNGFGCDRFGVMNDRGAGMLIVQFSYRGRDVVVKASVSGYAAAWLQAHPHSKYSGKKLEDHERKAFEQASLSVYSIVRDWIKGQITAIETGVLSFESVFMAQTLLPNGRTVYEEVTKNKLLKGPAE